MYVVFAEELNGAPPGPANNARTLDEAFARICCRCGLSYRFTSTDEGWALELTDVERPECSPEPILSQYKRLQDAQHDLMSQAVDGRVRGHVAISHEHFATTLIMRTVGGVRTLAG